MKNRMNSILTFALLFSLLSLSSTGAYAQAKKEKQDHTALIGVWDIEVDMGGQVQTGTFDFAMKEGTLTGVWEDPEGSVLDAENIKYAEGKYTLDLPTPDGTFNISLEIGKDNNMTGEATNDDLGLTASFTGKKRKK